MFHPELANFLEYLQIERQLSKATIDSYKIDLQQFLDSYENLEIAFKRQNLVEYFEVLNSQYERSSALRKFSAIRTFAKYLVSLGQIEQNYTNLIKTRFKKQTLPKYITQKQMNDFLENISGNTYLQKRDKALFELLYASGMRISELINLKVGDLNLSERIVRVVGKGNKERIIPLNDNTVVALDTWINEVRNFDDSINHQYVFTNKDKRPLTRQGCNYILKKYSKEMNLELTPHMFRHSLATHLISSGADIRIIQMILGHSDIATTQIYTAIASEKLQSEYEKHHILGESKKE